MISNLRLSSKCNSFLRLAATCNSNLNKFYHTQDLSNYRSLINVKGPDSSKYLQNLITNDINLLKNQSIKSIYAHILNNRGRTLFDTIIYSNDRNSSELDYLLEIDSNYLNDAIKLFNVFKIKKKIELKLVDDRFKLFAFYDDKIVLEQSQIEKSLHANYHILSQDPRTSFMGFRVVIDKNDQKSISLIQSSSDLNQYKKYLYKNGIAENNQDIVHASSIPLEYNLVFLNGVSFDKGCYLGQELVAKTHHTGVIRKRVMPLELTEKYNEYPIFKSGCNIVDLKTGKSIGKLRNIIENTGICLIRLSMIDNENMAVLDEKENEHRCKVSLPKYWLIDEALQKELSTAKL